MPASPFQERLEQEFQSRRTKNARYSLRAFAAFLGTDHSTLSQILRGARRTPVSQLRSWGKKLGMVAEEIAVYVAAEHVPDEPTSRRQEQLRHWTAEALAIVASDTPWKLLELVRSPGFRPDCRWIAKEISSTVDDVNLALSRLLRLRLLEVTANQWKDLTRVPPLTREEFRRMALVRIRARAAEDGIKLDGLTKH